MLLRMKYLSRSLKGRYPVYRILNLMRISRRSAGLQESTNPLSFPTKKGNSDIEEVKPKYKWVTSDSCRRSFCTNKFLAGTPVELIMKISGHRSLRTPGGKTVHLLNLPYYLVSQIEKYLEWFETQIAK